MKIAISGSVGVGKTTVATLLSKKLNYELIHLNEIAKNFKINEVKELQTFDFDIKKCIEYIESNYNLENIIFESHFSHLLSPKFIDVMIIINRDLKDLKLEYEKRKYNEQKIKDNLECETFNLSFYEAEEEGFEENQFIIIENNELLEVEDLVNEIIRKLCKKGKN